MTNTNTIIISLTDFQQAAKFVGLDWAKLTPDDIRRLRVKENKQAHEDSTKVETSDELKIINGHLTTLTNALKQEDIKIARLNEQDLRAQTKIVAKTGAEIVAAALNRARKRDQTGSGWTRDFLRTALARRANKQPKTTVMPSIEMINTSCSIAKPSDIANIILPIYQEHPSVIIPTARAILAKLDMLDNLSGKPDHIIGMIRAQYVNDDGVLKLPKDLLKGISNPRILERFGIYEEPDVAEQPRQPKPAATHSGFGSFRPGLDK